MHIVRLLEYGNLQDLQALTIITQPSGWLKVSNNKFYDPPTILAYTFTNISKSKLLQNYTETEKEFIEFSVKRGRNNASKRLHPDLKRILTVNTLWYHKDDGTDQPFQFISYAQTVKEFSLDALTKKILTPFNERNKMLVVPQANIKGQTKKTFKPKNSA